MALALEGGPWSELHIEECPLLVPDASWWASLLTL